MHNYIWPCTVAKKKLFYLRLKYYLFIYLFYLNPSIFISHLCLNSQLSTLTSLSHRRRPTRSLMSPDHVANPLRQPTPQTHLTHAADPHRPSPKPTQAPSPKLTRIVEPHRRTIWLMLHDPFRAAWLLFFFFFFFLLWIGGGGCGCGCG